MQFDKFTLKSQEAIQAAQQLARDNGQQEIRPAHVARVILEQKGGVVTSILKKMGVDIETIKEGDGWFCSFLAFCLLVFLFLILLPFFANKSCFYSLFFRQHVSEERSESQMSLRANVDRRKKGILNIASHPQTCCNQH